MARLYTRRGDTGETSLGDGRRVLKDHLRVEAYGALDEAIAFLGAARVELRGTELDPPLAFLQHRLFNAAGQVAGGKGAAFGVTAADVAWLERCVDRWEGASGPLRSFIVPAGASGAVWLHVGRTVLRRAERRVVALARAEGGVEPVLLQFLNRAADFLFAAARYANHLAGRPEEPWEKDLGPPQL